MNNIYVDEQPETCLDCEFCSKRNYCCILMKKDVREYRDECPLNLLSDRLAEERKKVVSEIRNKVKQAKLVYEWKGDEIHIEEILDQIERGTDD